MKQGDEFVCLLFVFISHQELRMLPVELAVMNNSLNLPHYKLKNQTD